MTPTPPNAPPIVAILRGVTQREILDVASALVDAGIAAIEVPLNSPGALASIETLCLTHSPKVLCGAGTVLSCDDVDQVARAGGKLIVSPNSNPYVIKRAISLGLIVMPGFATASEAFVAVEAGARSLKLYPASSYGPSHIKAMRDVLPGDVSIFAVGGVGAANLESWLTAGATGIGVGGELFRPGYSAEEVSRRANILVATWRSEIAPTSFRA